MTRIDRKLLAAAALALAACAPGEPQVPPASNVLATAVFDPTTGSIPVPNDLILAQDPSTLGVSPAQAELLTAFQNQGGFPNDQEVSISIDFTKSTLNSDGSTTAGAPALDVSTLTSDNIVAFMISATGGVEPVALDPVQASDYVVPSGATKGTLTLHNKNRQPWAPGQYVVGLRGGPSGIKTTDAGPVYASQVFYLIAQGQPLETEQNLGLLAAQAGSRQKALALAQQLDLVIKNYAVPFLAIDTRFPQRELAIMTTFKIAPAQTQVALDPGRGLVPLPIDLLRDPRPGGRLTPLAACTLAQGTLTSSGACVDSHGNPDGAAAGFAALDGFATTGAILASTNDLVEAGTITPATVQLYKLSGGTATLVDPTTYITEPCELTSSCSDETHAFSPVIALQPAGATANDATSVFRTRPLADASDYAVVISDGVIDKTNHGLKAGTVAKVLQFKNPLVDASGTSQLQGIDNATAFGLETMRQQLKPVLAAAATHGIGPGHVAMAYTFHTQTITSVAAQLGALPYTQSNATALPGAVTASTPAAAYGKYGVNANVTGPPTNLDEVLETTITTFNLLDPATGAFNPSGAAAAETINVLIATPHPTAAAVQNCTGSLTALGTAGLRCAPLVVYRHGLGRARGDMLSVANSLAAQGMVVVAIDGAKHGERAFCTPGVDNVTIGGTSFPVCSDGGHCTTTLPAGAQGDASPPGTCANGYFHGPVMSSCATPGQCPTYDPTKGGISIVSSNYLISANFFRTRDTLRQGIIDQSQLIRAIAFAPSGAPPTGHNVFDHMATRGVIIDPTRIYWMSQSLGSIEGAADVAANPRISKAVLNVGGGSIVDVFTNSPSFSSQVNQLLLGLGLSKGTSAYLQFLVVAKTIIDPADGINFVGHLKTATLPNLLPPLGGNTNGTVPQLAKAVLTQAAYCDQTVPNPWNFIFDASAGDGPLPGFTGFGTTNGDFELFYKGAPGVPDLTTCSLGNPPPATAVPHGFIIDWSDANITGAAQAAAADFLANGNLQPSLVMIP